MIQSDGKAGNHPPVPSRHGAGRGRPDGGPAAAGARRAAGGAGQQRAAEPAHGRDAFEPWGDGGKWMENGWKNVDKYGTWMEQHGK